MLKGTGEARAAVLALCAAFTALSVAGEPPPEPPEKPWRPFPEIAEILWYEGFESPTHSGGNGAPSEEQTAPPGHRSFKLGMKEKNMHMTGSLGKAKIPGPLDPNLVFVQFMIWSDELGKITTTFNETSGELQNVEMISKAKAWVPVVMKLGDHRSPKNRAKAGQVCSGYSITVTSRSNAACNVYVDDIIITYGAKPEFLMPRFGNILKQLAEITRTVGKDGFNYTPQGNDMLRAAAKASPRKRKPKTIVVLPGAPADGEALVKALTAAASKPKPQGFTFIAATAPDGTPVGGFEDAQTLLSYNLQKYEAEVALIFFSNADATKFSRLFESAQGFLLRALDMGAVPILCLPHSAAGDKAKADSFIGGMLRLANEASVPWIDANAAIAKQQANALDGNNELNAAAMEALLAIAFNAVKHVDAQLHKK